MDKLKDWLKRELAGSRRHLALTEKGSQIRAWNTGYCEALENVLGLLEPKKCAHIGGSISEDGRCLECALELCVKYKEEIRRRRAQLGAEANAEEG